MTNQEAIETVKHVIGRIEWDYPMDCVVALEMTVEALKREIPMEPGIGGDQNPGGTWWYMCPVCQTSVDKGDLYCRHCGRAMKWDA